MSVSKRTMRVAAVVGKVAALVVAALGSIAVALWLTPMQKVDAGGQTIRVGVTAPSPSLSGPGELDLFGQHIRTTIHFIGPVRPRLELAHITLTEQLKQFAASDSAAHALQDALVSGWHRFFGWQVVIAGVAAVVLFGVIAGWLRHGWRRTVAIIAAGLVVTEALNLGAIMTTAYTTPDKLRQVSSLSGLVGGTAPPLTPGQTHTGHTQIDKVAVVGDSTRPGWATGR